MVGALSRGQQELHGYEQAKERAGNIVGGLALGFTPLGGSLLATGHRRQPSMSALMRCSRVAATRPWTRARTQWWAG